MTTQRQPTPPPGIAEAVAGLLPAGVTVTIDADSPLDNPRVVVERRNEPKTIFTPGMTMMREFSEWYVDFPTPRRLMTRTEAGNYAAIMANNARVCEWLNANWKPE